MQKPGIFQNPERWQILSGSWLKIIAIVTMLIDHLAAFCWYNEPLFQQPLFTIGKPITIYLLLRVIGRFAFPLFAFLLVQGFIHTRSRKRYGLNLLVFAIISEIPWNLLRSGTWLCPKQNVFFTLLIGLLGLCAMERFKENRKYLLASLAGLLILSVLVNADYGCAGYAFILLLYAMRDNRILQAVIGSCILPGRWITGLAFIPINMYNGQRGFIKGTFVKYLFYAFYPLHLIAIYLFIH